MQAASVKETMISQYAGDGFDSFFQTINALYPWQGRQNDVQQHFHWMLDLTLLTAARKGDCRLTVGHFAATADFRHEPASDSHDIIVIVLLRGRLVFHFADGPVELLPGCAMIYQAMNLKHSEHFVDDNGGYEINYLAMSFACVQAYLSQVLHFPADRNLHLQTVLGLDNARGKVLAGLMATMGGNSFARESRQFSPSLQQRVIETFSQLLFESVPHRYSARTHAARLGPMPGHVRLACDYMQKRVLSHPGVADIAAAAGVSLRTMETAFRAFMDVTPTVYMRTLRLRMARDALLAGDERSIAEIGRAFGFAHTGRFAGYYCDLFGESPSDTRRCRLPG